MSYRNITTILLIFSFLHVIADSIFVLNNPKGDHYLPDLVFYGSIILSVLLYCENFDGINYLTTMGMCFIAIGIAFSIPMLFYVIKKK